MDIEEFVENFPADVQVPHRLIELLDYQNKVKGYYSGTFQLNYYGRLAVLSLFGQDQEAASQFIAFAHEPEGSVYAFWVYEGKTTENAPIVFLGSEGGGTVLANNLNEFYSLLAIGQELLGFAVEHPGWHKQINDKRLRHFRTWLDEKFGIHAPDDGEALVAKAKKNHPDLEAWIKQWQTTQS